MPDKLILAIDQGTTNTKALLVSRAGTIVAQASRPLGQSYPQPGWVEQDALAIWQSVTGAIDDCLLQAGEPPLAGVAVTNQREAVLLWDRRSGVPLGPVIGWQCHRSAPLCAELQRRGLEQFIRERSGLTIDPMFSASKARWLLDNTPDGGQRAAGGDLCLGTMDSWLLWNLSGAAVHACDVTNASRTQLMNLRALAWDADLLDIFGIPAAALPHIKMSSAVYGETAALGLLPAGLPIAGVIGDSHGALYGHANFGMVKVKATYGTGSSLMSPTPEPVLSRHGISTTVAWGRESAVYALEGNISFTGAAVQWLGEVLGLADPGPDVERLAATVDANADVYLVPAFAGLGAPHWNEQARALICGLTRGVTSAHLARAALEAISYQVRDVFDAMEADAGRQEVLLADGGASRNRLLMQFQADIIGRPVVRSASADLSAMGAAYLAGLALGIWTSEEEIAALAPVGERFEPAMPEGQRAALYAGWQEALARAELGSNR